MAELDRSARHAKRSGTRTLAPDGDGTPLGIVHRDVTPANVLVSREDMVKRSDFRIESKANDERTRTGVQLGKTYLSP